VQVIGTGIVADNSALVLAEFTNLHGNEFVGLNIRFALASASDGVIANVPIGVTLAPPDGFVGSLVDCLRAGLRVILRPDQIPFQGPFSVPCDPALGACPPPTPCMTVPFVCPWCA